MSITLDRVSKAGKTPSGSPYGYVIAEDGTCYSLAYKWYHGVVIALLYPEKAAKYGLVVPDERDDIDLFAFQKLDTRWGHNFPVIRVSVENMMDRLCISKGNPPINDAQMKCLHQILLKHNLQYQDHVHYDDTSPNAMTVSKLLATLKERNDRKDRELEAD